jgi:hypothetical protein
LKIDGREVPADDAAGRIAHEFFDDHRLSDRGRRTDAERQQGGREE